MEVSELASFTIGAGGSSALLLFFFKRWVDRMDLRLDLLTKMLTEIEISLARKEGESIGQHKVIWVEIEKTKSELLEMRGKIYHHDEELLFLKSATRPV